MLRYTGLVRYVGLSAIIGGMVVISVMMSSSKSLRSSYHWSKQGSTDVQVTPAHVRALLATVKDTELDANIAELGLIYGVEVPHPGSVQITMTLTTPACPYGRQILTDVQRTLLSDPAINDVHLRLVFDPPWSWDSVAKDVGDRILLRFTQTNDLAGGGQR